MVLCLEVNDRFRGRITDTTDISQDLLCLLVSLTLFHAAICTKTDASVAHARGLCRRVSLSSSLKLNRFHSHFAAVGRSVAETAAV